MELYEKVELAMWSLRRTIERARHLQLASARLAEEYTRRRQSDRLHLSAFDAEPHEDVPSSDPGAGDDEDAFSRDN